MQVMPAFPPLPSVTVETGSGAALLVSDPAARGISLAIAHSASPWRPLLPDSDDPALTDVSALVAALHSSSSWDAEVGCEWAEEDAPLHWSADPSTSALRELVLRRSRELSCPAASPRPRDFVWLRLASIEHWRASCPRGGAPEAEGGCAAAAASLGAPVLVMAELDGGRPKDALLQLRASALPLLPARCAPQLRARLVVTGAPPLRELRELVAWAFGPPNCTAPPPTPPAPTPPPPALPPPALMPASGPRFWLQLHPSFARRGQSARLIICWQISLEASAATRRDALQLVAHAVGRGGRGGLLASARRWLDGSPALVARPIVPVGSSSWAAMVELECTLSTVGASAPAQALRAVLRWLRRLRRAAAPLPERLAHEQLALSALRRSSIRRGGSGQAAELAYALLDEWLQTGRAPDGGGEDSAADVEAVIAAAEQLLKQLSDDRASIALEQPPLAGGGGDTPLAQPLVATPRIGAAHAVGEEEADRGQTSWARLAALQARYRVVVAPIDAVDSGKGGGGDDGPAPRVLPAPNRLLVDVAEAVACESGVGEHAPGRLMAVDGGVLEVLANERCALFLRQLVEPPGRGTEAGGGPASATWQVELAMPDAVATSAGATALELLLWRLRPAISRLQDEAAAALLSVDVQRDDVGLAISLRGRPAALPNVLRLVLATLHRAMNEEGSADERAWVLAAVALRDALVAQVAATNASALAVGGEVLKSAFLAPYFTSARARLAALDAVPPATLRALLRRAAAGRIELRGVVLLIGHGGLNRTALAAHALGPFFAAFGCERGDASGALRPPRARLPRRRPLRLPEPPPRAAAAALAIPVRRHTAVGDAVLLALPHASTAVAEVADVVVSRLALRMLTTALRDEFVTVQRAARAAHGWAQCAGAPVAVIALASVEVAARDLLARLEQWLGNALRSSSSCSELLGRSAFEAHRAARLREIDGAPWWQPAKHAEALLAEATAAAATEVAAAVDCPGTATEAAALRALSYSGFVGAAWRLFGRRAPRLAVLVRGNLSTRGLQYRAATLGWLKLQNSNSQRLVTHKKPSYRQAREWRGDRKLQ